MGKFWMYTFVYRYTNWASERAWMHGTDVTNEHPSFQAIKWINEVDQGHGSFAIFKMVFFEEIPQEAYDRFKRLTE